MEEIRPSTLKWVQYQRGLKKRNKEESLTPNRYETPRQTFAGDHQTFRGVRWSQDGTPRWPECSELHVEGKLCGFNSEEARLNRGAEDYQHHVVGVFLLGNAIDALQFSSSCLVATTIQLKLIRATRFFLTKLHEHLNMWKCPEVSTMFYSFGVWGLFRFLMNYCSPSVCIVVLRLLNVFCITLV